MTLRRLFVAGLSATLLLNALVRSESAHAQTLTAITARVSSIEGVQRPVNLSVNDIVTFSYLFDPSGRQANAYNPDGTVAFTIPISTYPFMTALSDAVVTYSENLTNTFDEFLGYSGYSETLDMVYFDPTSCACRFFQSKLPPSVIITHGYDVVSGPSPVFDEGFIQLWSAGQQSVTTIRLDWLSVTDSQVATVPEPSTYALIAAGLAGVGVAARRRRRDLAA